MRGKIGKISISIVMLMCMLVFNSSYILAYNDDEEQGLSNDNKAKQIEQRLKEEGIYSRGYSQDKFTVVIDAGHGGKDSGAVNKSLKVYEKNLNLDIAKAIEKRLKSLGINVVMTRSTDIFVELPERSAIANAMGADLFVSIHNDTPEGNGDGAHIIHSVYDKNGGISKTLATDIGNSIKNKTKQNLRKYNPIWSRLSSDGVSDYYAVIRQTKMPAVIIEHAYMNSNDIKAVDTLEKRNTMGTAVADGIYKAINENFKGWIKFKDTWKYYNPTTKTQATDWQWINSNWYYFEENGLMAKGWKQVDGSWYYLESSGAMAKGWKQVNGIWYYLESNGMMATGWKRINENWYYLESNGAMAKGWKQVDGKMYYLESNGSMVTGWKWIDGVWKYLKPHGAMAEMEWILVDGKWYYLNSGGAMAKGWLQLGNNKYYLKSNGEMVIGNFNIDGTNYYFDESGKLI